MISENNPISKTDFPMAPNDLRIALESFKQGMLRSLSICFPACVYEYDRNTHIATVMPLVKQGFFNGEWYYIRRQPFKVSVRNIQCGGFTIDWPVYIGDTGWVFSSDRDTLLLKQEGALTNSVLAKDRPIAIVEDDYQQKPNQPILHSLTDGFFLLDNWGQWNANRYKDNPSIAVGSALYIGTSFDTNDNREDKESEGKIFQKGSDYENNVSSSIVLQKNGGVSIASSSDNSKKQNANLYAKGNYISLTARDMNKLVDSSILVDAEDGIVVEQHSEQAQKHFICSVTPGEFHFRVYDNQKTLNIHFEDGKLSMSTSGGADIRVGGDVSFRGEGKMNIANEGEMNINSRGNVNVQAAEQAHVIAKNARLVAEEAATVAAKEVSASATGTINIGAGEVINIGAGAKANINAGDNLNIAAAKTINITAPSGINLVTAGNTTIMNKKKGASIKVSTLSKDSSIEVETKGTNTKVNVTTKGKSSPIGIKAQGESSPINIVSEGKSSTMTVQTQGAQSNVEISAMKSKVSISAGEQIQIDSTKDVNITAKGNSNITINGNLTASVKNNATIAATQEAKVTGKTVMVTATGPLTLSGKTAEVKADSITLSSSKLSFLGRNIAITKEGDVVATK